MITYSKKDIEKALKKAGLKKGQIVYINPEIYKFGYLIDSKSNNDYFKIFFDSIIKIIGKKGTLAINSYTFQTLRYNKKFVHEKSISSSGSFSEYVRKRKGAIRSDHPVFSVTAYGKHKKEICGNNSLSNYGYNSPYMNFLNLNGKILNLGMEPWLNPFYHVAEFLVGVPYCYNKLTKVPYYKKNKKQSKNFTSFVTYKNLKVRREFTKLQRKIKTKKIFKSSKLGSGYIYCCSSKSYFNIVLEELMKDQFFLFKKKPSFKRGKIPFA